MINDLTEDQIRKQIEDGSVDWHRISKYQSLSETLMREYADKLDWYWISIHQKLSESFLREFADKLDWRYIVKHQSLSDSFIIEMQLKGYL